MRILLTNDDGVTAPGLRALRRELKSLGEVVVAAPASEQSAAAHSLTLLNPLVVQEVFEGDERIGYAVEGKPADCVKIAVCQLLKEPVDLVVSGINAGSNASINVLYSGTVAAAIEAAFFNITAIAVSLELADLAHFPRAAQLARGVIEQILEHRPKAGELFNVNIPDLSAGDPVGIRSAAQGLVCWRESYEARIDPRGRKYYWLLPDSLTTQDDDDTDLAGLARRCITVTPLHYDLTDRARYANMQSWRWRQP